MNDLRMAKLVYIGKGREWQDKEPFVSCWTLRQTSEIEEDRHKSEHPCRNTFLTTKETKRWNTDSVREVVSNWERLLATFSANASNFVLKNMAKIHRSLDLSTQARVQRYDIIQCVPKVVCDVFVHIPRIPIKEFPMTRFKWHCLHLPVICVLSSCNGQN